MRGLSAASWSPIVAASEPECVHAVLCCSPALNVHRRTRTDSPAWRRGPPGKPHLCNACGVRYLGKGHLNGYMPGCKARGACGLLGVSCPAEP